MQNALKSGTLFMHHPMRSCCSNCGVLYIVESSVMKPPGGEQLKLKRLYEGRRRRWERKRGVIFTQTIDTPIYSTQALLLLSLSLSIFLHTCLLYTAIICKGFLLCVLIEYLVKIWHEDVILKMTITFICTSVFQCNYKAVER